MPDRRQVIVPLLLFFGAKLVVTAALVVYIIRHPSFSANSPLRPVTFVLACLVLLQMFVLGGLAFRHELARQLGVGICIASGTLALVACLVSPLAWYAGVFVLAGGLALLLLNAAAIVGLLSGATREWCDVKPSRFDHEP